MMNDRSSLGLKPDLIVAVGHMSDLSLSLWSYSGAITSK